MENWQVILVDTMRSDVFPGLTTVYLVSWIFLGNFILLNLFLAILLDSFSDEEEEQELTPVEVKEKIKEKIKAF